MAKISKTTAKVLATLANGGRLAESMRDGRAYATDAQFNPVCSIRKQAVREMVNAGLIREVANPYGSLSMGSAYEITGQGHAALAIA